ncbi:hypothetical protein [Brevundimonas sp.]|uniref:hypothetical protein n=1 Tax=Brevundimonas sp. TaxID=1871086 RepID=UPI00257D2960|nr:hypothetical protein [Brevundimonas sp.]
MPSSKPVPAVLPWLTALAAAPLVVIVAAVAATRFGGVDVGLAYDVLTWTVARGLAWVALAAARRAGGSTPSPPWSWPGPPSPDSRFRPPAWPRTRLAT